MLHFKKVPFFIFLWISLAPIIISQLPKPSATSQIISILSPLSPIQAVALATEKLTQNPLSDLTEKYLINDNETYGVFIKNLKTGETYGYNEDVTFQTASLYKLWVMGEAFEKISEGSLNSSGTVSGNLDDFDKKLLQTSNNENEDAQQKDRQISFEVSGAIEKMITVSDNYAALSLVSKLGDKSIKNFLGEYGFIGSEFGHPPTSNAGDIGLFFDKLYHGQIVSPDYSLTMMDILKRQKINDRIPKYLPEGVLVGHKTGELDEYKNDAGIVYAPSGDYIIVVLSKTKDPYIAAEKIARYSEAVYGYFSSEATE